MSVRLRTTSCPASSCRRWRDAGPCGYERSCWCADRGPAGHGGGADPGSSRSRPCGGCRPGSRGGGHPRSEVGVHVLADLDQVLFGQVTNAGVRVHTGGGEDLLGPGAPDAEDVGEGDLHALFARDVNTGNACHSMAPVVFGGLPQNRSRPPTLLTGEVVRPGPRPPPEVSSAVSWDGFCVCTFTCVARRTARCRSCVRQPWRCLWRRLSQMTMTRP